MCGIYGLVPITKKPWSEAEKKLAGQAFNLLAAQSVTRGRDATGMALIRANKPAIIRKDTVPSNQYIFRSEWWNVTRNLPPDTQALLGHTRFATHGRNVPGNAHPFIFGHDQHGELIGTHNGIVMNHLKFGDYECDSASLFFGLSKLSDEQIPELMAEIRGGYAVAMYRNNKFFFGRNRSSPLYICCCRDFRSLLYASEVEIIARVQSFLNLSLSKIKDVEPNKLFKLDLDTFEEETATLPDIPEEEGVLCMLVGLG